MRFEWQYDASCAVWWIVHSSNGAILASGKTKAEAVLRLKESVATVERGKYDPACHREYIPDNLVRGD